MLSFQHPISIQCPPDRPTAPKTHPSGSELVKCQIVCCRPCRRIDWPNCSQQGFRAATKSYCKWNYLHIYSCSYFIFTKISFSDVEDKLQEDTQWGQTMRQLLFAHDVQAAGESQSVAVRLVVGPRCDGRSCASVAGQSFSSALWRRPRSLYHASLQFFHEARVLMLGLS